MDVHVVEDDRHLREDAPVGAGERAPRQHQVAGGGVEDAPVDPMPGQVRVLGHGGGVDVVADGAAGAAAARHQELADVRHVPRLAVVPVDER